MHRNTLAFTWGKFEIPHMGHMKIIGELTQYPNHMVFCSPSKNHHVSDGMKLAIIKDAFKCPVMMMPKFSDVVQYIKNNGYREAILFIGEDRFDDFKRMLKVFSNEIENEVRFTVNMIDRDISDISSSKMRNFIKNDDVSNFYSHLPSHITIGTANFLLRHNKS